ncbi:type IV pili methyl-accepting chemotaxis transducer N-terminal domain-containing protein [Chitiniphilus eburneus]|uniref:Sensor protein n=1 Tax=Chitiniphilus eburneus TaxID=2571148 RepID=A0A4U0PEY0_9NEIS|nr:type IV pili methyl-accepting chemotaxis transducer N-terminal domain-containing protein [Chitiniphilus eburneus]TJZ66385.1 HAMP domain-containing protein [Chitiniphilus eburneus]
MDINPDPYFPAGAADPADRDGPRLRDRLSTRIVASSIVALLVVVSMVCWTLWLSWQLEGAGAAINDTGSLRMRANRVGIELLQRSPDHVLRTRALIATQDDTLARLRRGVPARPLFLPQDTDIRTQFERVALAWQERMHPAAEHALRGETTTTYMAELPHFVDEADRLVRLIEHDNARKTTLLRLSQAVLLAISCAGTLAMIYLLYLWIILPVLRLRDGLSRMAGREFGVRLPVESRDEFGVLAQGFNHMADQLAGLYRDLEARVASKTAQLAAQNRELEALYDMTAFLNEPGDIEALCCGFLQRVRRQFGADGGSVRVIDPDGDKLHLMVSDGLSATLEHDEHCMSINSCFCGQATQQGMIVIRDFRQAGNATAFHCSREGFQGLGVFRIVSGNTVLGSFSLHFRKARALQPAETQLLESLGQHLGVALENRRLGAEARQMAVVQERSLMAQGLHDSIAQGLNYLNLQVQMLEQSANAGALDDVRELVPLLRAGVEESYQDVRELLLNFRARLEQGELLAGVEETIARFRRQTGVAVTLDIAPQAGPPLPPEQQLQVLFILQEALSNVRKHADARHVRVSLSNARDFDLSIEDDGRGYDPAEVSQRGEAHIGLNIMRERAERIHAELRFNARPGQGVRVDLHLPESMRQPA